MRSFLVTWADSTFKGNGVNSWSWLPVKPVVRASFVLDARRAVARWRTVAFGVKVIAEKLGRLHSTTLC
jgi:hypothetical protein